MGDAYEEIKLNLVGDVRLVVVVENMRRNNVNEEERGEHKH